MAEMYANLSAVRWDCHDFNIPCVPPITNNITILRVRPKRFMVYIEYSMTIDSSGILNIELNLSLRTYTYCVGRAADNGYFSNKDCAGVILYGAEKCTQVTSKQILERGSISQFFPRCALMLFRFLEEMVTLMTILPAGSLGKLHGYLLSQSNNCICNWHWILQRRKALRNWRRHTGGPLKP